MYRIAALTCLLALGCSASDGRSGKPGANGTDGDDGLMGLVGHVGDKGDTGTRGPRGDKGETGSKGDKGDRGSVGSPGASVALTAEPNGSHCTVGGVKLSVGSSTEYACDGLPGMPGDKGDKGDQGDKGDTGESGAFHLLDGNDAVLGTLIPAVGGMMVRTQDGVLIQYGPAGQVADVNGSAGSTLYFTSPDCSGTAYTQATKIVGAGIFSNGMLYAAELPYSTMSNFASEQAIGGQCSASSPGPRQVLVAALVGPQPTDAVLPLQIQ